MNRKNNLESSGSWLMKKCYVSVLKELCVWWAWLVFKLLKKNSETTCCSWLWRMYGSLLELKNYYPDLCIVNERWKESRPTVSKSDLDMRFSENLLSVWNQPNRMNDSYMWTIINNPETSAASWMCLVVYLPIKCYLTLCKGCRTSR